MKYAVAILGSAAFLALLRLSSHSHWLWAVMTGWVLCGAVWSLRWSRIPYFWVNRKRGRGLPKDAMLTMAQAILLLVYVSAWPIWLIFGEDVFD